MMMSEVEEAKGRVVRARKARPMGSFASEGVRTRVVFGYAPDRREPVSVLSKSTGGDGLSFQLHMQVLDDMKRCLITRTIDDGSHVSVTEEVGEWALRQG